MSTGNDIVALIGVNKERTCEFRFYSKILSASEQDHYHQLKLKNLPFENYVWLLWSVKESAYKFLKRNNHDLKFTPVKFVVTAVELLAVTDYAQFQCDSHNFETYCCKIEVDSTVLYARCLVSDKWITAVVNDKNDFENVNLGITAIEDENHENQSTTVRQFLIKKLNTIFPGDLSIEKNSRNVPFVIQNGELLDLPISLSHDGNFVAYSCNLQHAILADA